MYVRVIERGYVGVYDREGIRACVCVIDRGECVCA